MKEYIQSDMFHVQTTRTFETGITHTIVPADPPSHTLVHKGESTETVEKLKKSGKLTESRLKVLRLIKDYGATEFTAKQLARYAKRRDPQISYHEIYTEIVRRFNDLRPQYIDRIPLIDTYGEPKKDKRGNVMYRKYENSTVYRLVK